MKLGIMQPYFVPYIGYWQRVSAVDVHVIYDDVNYIKGGWINRNRILLNGEPHYFNLPLVGASPNKLINQIGTSNNDILQKKMLRTLEQAYKRAPYFCQTMQVLEPIICNEEENLAKYLVEQIKRICEYLQINTKILISSDVPKNNSLHAQDKVLEICRILGASEYYNARSGRELYDKSTFAAHNILLKFIEADNTIVYRQFNSSFLPSLSIVDVMMFNSVPDIQKLLTMYTLS